MSRVILCLALIFPLAACNTVAGPIAKGPALLEPARASFGAYTLRPSDQIRLQVYDDQGIAGDYQIDSSGYISVPLAGRVKAGGRTPGQLEKELERRLTGILNKPEVNVQVTTYGSLYVHGEVKRAGDFPFRPGLTVKDAIALAGGYTYRADEGEVILIRAGSTEEQILPMSVRVPVYPGDNIRIPERFF